MDEIWEKHQDLPFHEVSSLGRVRVAIRVGRFSQSVGTTLNGTRSPKGYRQVRIKDANGETKLRWVHRLVLETFVGSCPAGHQCAHLNGIPDDNRLENLRWATPTENQADRVQHGTSNRGRRNPMFVHGEYARYE